MNIKINTIQKKIKPAVINTPLGDLTKPIIISDNIMILKIRDVREIENKLSLEEIKNQLITSEKTKILNMHSLSHYDKLRRTVQ